jgi:V8-like Glu-specific endopeptidase
MPATPSQCQPIGITSWGGLTGVRARILRTPSYIVLTTLLSLVMGCAGEADQADDVHARVEATGSAPTIFGGDQDDDDQALPGVVALRVGAGGKYELCSAAVLAPNLILTARHCVTKNLTTSVSCDEEGRSANGPHVAGDQEPGNIAVYLGASPTFTQKPAALAKAVLAPQGKYLCDADIALVVLDRPLQNVQPLPVRLGTPARAGETIRSVGYGQNDLEIPIGTRFRKTGVSVLAQGKAVSASKTPLGAHEFEVGRSICQGDSGGPAIAEGSGAIIGVVSRGGGCDQDFGHIYTTTAGFEDLFAEASRLAKASLRVEAQTLSASEPATTTRTEETTSASCSAAPGTGTTTGAGTRSTAPALGLLLAAALVLRARRRG